VHWHIIANLGFKFQSTFTAHCGRGACREKGRGIIARKSGGIISRYATHYLALLFGIAAQVLDYIKQ